jgi:hypothetical protein
MSFNGFRDTWSTTSPPLIIIQFSSLTRLFAEAKSLEQVTIIQIYATTTTTTIIIIIIIVIIIYDNLRVAIKN